MKKVAGITPQSRADFGKAHVIISEKRDKKAAKFLVQDLPYPYTSKAQFERSLQNPLGKEWNTRIATQRATLPKITKKVRCLFYFRAIEVYKRNKCFIRWGQLSNLSRSDSSFLLVHFSNTHTTSFGELFPWARMALGNHRPLHAPESCFTHLVRLFWPAGMLWNASPLKVEPSHCQKL